MAGFGHTENTPAQMNLFRRGLDGFKRILFKQGKPAFLPLITQIYTDIYATTA
jgi:hypothetical protein